MDDRFVWGIRLVRGLSALVEVSAVMILFRMNDTAKMLRLNGILGLVGPLIFIAVSALGLADSLGKIQPTKLAFVLAGVALVVWGTRPS